MTNIVLKLKVVTPMFISGADQQIAELREPSIKGMLRFWYRVLYPNDLADEAEVFGGQGKEQGQSKVLLRITERKIFKGNAGDDRWHDKKVAYLGYGAIARDRAKKKSVTVRPYFNTGTSFVLTIVFRKLRGKDGQIAVLLKEDLQLRLKNAIWAWLMFGGLGARSRHGFGSLVVEEAEGMEDLPSLHIPNSDELKKTLQTFIKGFNSVSDGLPVYTHWSKKARCLIFQEPNGGEQTLETLGQTIHDLRSFKGAKKLSWVNKDHDLMRDFVDSTKGKKIAPSRAPYRAAFGLPHNYFFTSLKDGKSGEVNLMDENKKGRRASPLFFKVHQFWSIKNPHDKSKTDNKCCVIALFLPAELIPSNKKVRISTSDQGDKRNIPMKLDNDFTAIHDLLNELEKPDYDGLKVYP